MSAWQRSKTILRESWNLLMQDPELLWLPVMSGGLMLVVVITFAGGFTQAMLNNANDRYEPSLWIFITVFVIGAALANYFNAVLVSCVAIRLRGGDPKLSNGFRVANRRIWQILVWSLVAATIGLIFRALARRGGILGRIIADLGGIAWGFISVFMIPILVLESGGVKFAIRRSGELLKKTWGENITGNVSIGLITFLIGAPIIILIVVLMFVSLGQTKDLGEFLRDYFILLFIAYLVIACLTIFQTAVRGIFQTALYYFAATGQAPNGISAEILQQSFRSKNRSNRIQPFPTTA